MQPYEGKCNPGVESSPKTNAKFGVTQKTKRICRSIAANISVIFKLHRKYRYVFILCCKSNSCFFIPPLIWLMIHLYSSRYMHTNGVYRCLGVHISMKDISMNWPYRSRLHSSSSNACHMISNVYLCLLLPRCYRWQLPTHSRLVRLYRKPYNTNIHAYIDLFVLNAGV